MPPRAVWKPQPYLADCRLAGAREAGRRQHPGIDTAPCPNKILPRIYNSDETGTKIMTPRDDTDPHDVATQWMVADWLGLVSQRHPEMIRTHPRIIHASIHLYTTSNRSATKTRLNRTDPHAVEIPTPLVDC